jgi:tRNA G18 (ribose-2'-O)-methylase SpoU
LPWEHFERIEDAIQSVRTNKCEVVAVELDPQAKTLAEYQVPDRVAYILGNEVTGVSEGARSQADTMVQIPMLGKKESLNVSVTAGIVMYHDLLQ